MTDKNKDKPASAKPAQAKPAPAKPAPPPKAYKPRRIVEANSSENFSRRIIIKGLPSEGKKNTTNNTGPKENDRS